jgi:hypothetical protein
MKIQGMERIFKGNALAFVAGQIERGEFPDLEVLSQGLARDEEMPSTVRQWLSDYLAGKVKRPRGKPKSVIDAQIERESKEFLSRWIRHTIKMHKALGGKSDEIFEAFAPELGLEPSALAQIVRRKRKG